MLYLTLPAVLGVLPYAPGYIYNNKSMTLFYVVLGAGLLFPAACAQAWRKRSPVEAAKHRKEWSFLSVWALIALAFIAVYQVTPARRNALLAAAAAAPALHAAVRRAAGGPARQPLRRRSRFAPLPRPRRAKQAAHAATGPLASLAAAGPLSSAKDVIAVRSRARRARACTSLAACQRRPKPSLSTRALA
jgi:hypothetical protein